MCHDAESSLHRDVHELLPFHSPPGTIRHQFDPTRFQVGCHPLDVAYFIGDVEKPFSMLVQEALAQAIVTNRLNQYDSCLPQAKAC